MLSKPPMNETRSRLGFQAGRRIAGLALLWILALPAGAVGRGDDAWRAREDNAVWRAECGACHIAFPPALLSGDDWRVLMAELDRHFGADASLDAKTRQEISAFLERNGGADRIFGSRAETPRITGTDWFVGKHRSAIRLWRKGRVKSLADCAACHRGSDLEKMTAD
jgi:Dihaem cytochrome c